jgi:threonine/homoserine/homoserine lactone efflux protein
MSVQASSPRRATKSIGAAFVELLITLVICIAILLAFLIAPLVALGLAYLVYVVWRGRGSKKNAAPAAPGEPQQQRSAGVAHGFGSGTS